jgi:phosphatidylglycerol:prolipoprotein diacylglycerol transferase
MQQLADGELIGIEATVADADTNSLVVTNVWADSPAEKIGLQKDDRISIAIPDSLSVRAVKEKGLTVDDGALITSDRSGVLRFPIDDFPNQSLGVHPTQIYSSVNAIILCLVLWFYFPFRKSDGEVFAAMLMLYAIGRFLLESIRTDELGVLGTPFTISQCISMLIFVAGVTAFVYFRSRGKRFEVGVAVF